MGREPQLSFAFARSRRKKGGLLLDEYHDLVRRLRRDAARVSRRFGLPTYELDADRPDSHDRYGICSEDGRIRVRFVHARTGRPLKYSALIDTVVHELAHLRYMDHGPRWEALYRRMLEWCRRAGIYRPGQPEPGQSAPPSASGPDARQLDLFG
jgi:hypothetical protein